MKIFFTILLSKILRFLLKIIGKGSSFPGQIALKIYPDIIKDIKLPRYVIAVTGSNGKTSTVEFIYHVLVNNGYKVAYNYEGSNQIEGVATLVLNDASLSSKCRSDVLLIEADERYSKIIFECCKPTHTIVTNLFRDQLTRNGNREWVYSSISNAIYKKTLLFINADDPLTSQLSSLADNVIYYGMNKLKEEPIVGIYDDGVYCPKCMSKLKYEYRHFDNLGKYVCDKCGYHKEDTKYSLTDVDLNNSSITINNQYKIRLALSSLYNSYNLLACFAVCSEIGVNSDNIVNSLNNYLLKNKRIVKFKVNNKDGIFLASKHENSTSYNQSMSVIRNDKDNVSLIIVVDRISRKYFTSETSWLWDIDFDLLNKKHIKHIILSGKHAYDLALRFEYTNINSNIIEVIPDVSCAIDRFKTVDENKLYIITCFADQDNVLSYVELV